MAVTFCAIRWDAYYSAAVGAPAVATLAGLSDPDYQSRAPFFATQRGTGLLRYDYTQATMDQEITAALAGNVKCWAFLRYITREVSEPGMENGLALYQSSTNRGAMKWASMDQSNTLGSTGAYATQVARLVAEMGQAHYQTVGANRPLFFLYNLASDLAARWGGSNANLKTALDAIRSGAIAAGRGNPYIVLVNSGATSSATIKTALGCDAISDYAGPVPDTLGAAYSTLDTAVQAYWAAYAALAETVPICTLGWSRAPRIQRPVPWERTSQRPYFGLRRSFLPTSSELAAHVQAAVAFVDAHPTECPERVILAYAWNEHDEGGWLCPTRGDPPTGPQPGGARLAALAPVLA